MSDILCLPGRGLEAEVFREGSGPPLLYLHGAFGPEWSRPLVAALAKTHTVLMPSLPGFGASGGLDGMENFYDVAVWLDEVVGQLGLGSVAIAGHDFGGAVAAEYACLFRERVAKLALLAPLGLWVDAHPMPDFFGLTPGALTRVLFADAASPPAAAFNAQYPDKEQQLDSILRRRQALIAAAQLLWPIPDKGLAKRLYRLQAPTLLLWGDADPLLGAPYEEAFQQAIPGATLQKVPGGHMIPQEAPNEAAAAIASFLKD
jgi:pimeloyl-ACP methyl ester carboxylesterase